MTATSIPSGIVDTDYIAFGLAHCYTMDEGHLEDYWVFEPLTGATLECITGVRSEKMWHGCNFLSLHSQKFMILP
jgi:hypothetical protein